MQKREMNKKAQEGFSLTTLLALIFGAVVLIVVILWITGTFDILGGGTQLANQQLEAMAQVCITSAKQNLRVAYCSNPQEVEILGNTQYVTCEYPDLQASINEAKQRDGFQGITCDANSKTILCEKLESEGQLREDTKVNGVFCSNLLGEVNVIFNNDADENLAKGATAQYAISVTRTALENTATSTPVTNRRIEVSVSGPITTTRSFVITDNEGEATIDVTAGTTTGAATITAQLDANHLARKAINVN